VRRLLPLALLALGLAACSGSSTAQQPDLTAASARTVAGGSARFTMVISVNFGGTSVQAHETGTVSFTQRRAHLYKLVPGGGLPQELILSGPYTYANANIQAALNDSSVKPWTKLDTRRLNPTELKRRPDELAHVRALAYLPQGVVGGKAIGSATVDTVKTTHFRGTVDPARLATRVPSLISTAVRNDYLDKPFPAEFWVDDAGRVRRVKVDYRTPKGTRITVVGGFSEFGVAIDLTLPPARSIQDIIP
jgi:hypothetical protein